MRNIFAAAVGSVVALVGFAGAANASATIDLIWASTGTDTISGLDLSQTATLRVILTAGPLGSRGAAVSVDYSQAVDKVTVTSFQSTPGGNLPFSLGTAVNTGTRVETINSAALPPTLGAGLQQGQSHQLGTVTFVKDALGNGTFEFRSDDDGAADGVLDLAGNNIGPTTTFNSAFLINVPEPGAISLLALAVGGLALAGRGRRS